MYVQIRHIFLNVYVQIRLYFNFWGNLGELLEFGVGTSWIMCKSDSLREFRENLGESLEWCGMK